MNRSGPIGIDLRAAGARARKAVRVSAVIAASVVIASATGCVSEVADAPGPADAALLLLVPHDDMRRSLERRSTYLTEQNRLVASSSRRDERVDWPSATEEQRRDATQIG
ncbi:MAG: hypothetical protein AAGC55_07790, partial [Myxococcota bacterium]